MACAPFAKKTGFIFKGALRHFPLENISQEKHRQVLGLKEGRVLDNIF
jgi:hypothetical protein